MNSGSGASGESAASRRVLEMDAVRGAAMFAVCIAHSGFLVADRSLAYALKLGGMLATPTFLLLSGLVCGYLSEQEGGPTPRLRLRLIDRGLFLLIVAHLILSLTHSLWMPLADATLHSFYITDAVGLSLIAAGLLIGRVNALGLLLMGLSLYGGTVIVDALMFYRDSNASAVSHLLFGARPDGAEGYVVPAIPYLGIFLIGIAMGIGYSRLRAHGKSMTQIARVCQCLGIACIAVALMLKLGGKFVLPRLDSAWRSVALFLTAPSHKLPPGPTYVLTFGGAGLVMAGSLVQLAQTRFRPLVAFLAVVGRASLIVYIVQALLLVAPAHVFDLPEALWVWASITVTSLAALWLLAYFWDARGYNRFITIGLRKVRPRSAAIAAT